MAGLVIDMAAIRRRMVDDFNEIFGPMGMIMVADFSNFDPRSFWQQLRDEITARPRVF